MKKVEGNIKLLLVDDEKEFLQSAAAALKRRNIEVHTAENGEKALVLMKSDGFDAAVVDVKMPGIDGVELFRRMKKLNPDLPVIILTGHGSVTQAFETSREGIYDYIPKPCEMDELAEKINTAVTESRSKMKITDTGTLPSETTIRVLLVDDEEELLESLTPVLQRRRMEVHAVLSGGQALAMLKELTVDVVILDVKMPDMDGIEVLKRIRNRYKDLEVILLTGHPNVGDALEGVKLGARDYLVKPPDIELLTEKIREAYNALQAKSAERREKTVSDILERHPND